MKKLLLLLSLLLIQTSIYAQKDGEPDENNENGDELIMNEASLRYFKGSLITKNDEIYLNSSDCDFIGKETVKLNLNEKDYKKWKKKMNKTDNIINNVRIKGSLNSDVIDVAIIYTPFVEPKKPSGAPNVDLYVAKVFEIYSELKKKTDEANYIKVISKEEKDAELGTVTSNTYYDSNCKKLNNEEVIALRPKALATTGETLLYLTDLLSKQVELSTLSETASNELQTIKDLRLLSATKNYANALLVSKSLYVEIPKVISNLNKTKSILEKLKNE